MHLQANYQPLVDWKSEALANHCRPWQCQYPLGCAPLATADKDANHIVLVSSLEPLLLCDSIWSTHGSSDPPSSNAADSKSGHLDPWEALCQHLTLYSQLVASYQRRRTTVTHTSQPDAAGASPAFIRNLYGSLSKYWNQHPTIVVSK